MKTSSSVLRVAALLSSFVATSGCGVEAQYAQGLTSPSAIQYAAEVISYEIGDAGGFGSESLPEALLGEPEAPEAGSGALDVLSLGLQGEVIIRFAEPVSNRTGIDIVVFENPFSYGDGLVFTELGEVSVSEDGVHWHVFHCDAAQDEGDSPTGCAGRTPTASNSNWGDTLESLGGDGFDIADFELESIQYVRVQDLSQAAGAAPTHGFDLDAVAGWL